MKHGKKFAALALTTALCVSGTMSVAASNLLDTISDGTGTETDGDYAEDTSYSLLRGNQLNYGTTSIKKLSSMEVTIYGTTQCHKVCDDVILELALERKVNGIYSTYKSWEFEAYNVSNLTRQIDVIVPSGYYYRVSGYHAAIDGGNLESTSTLSGGILVN
jgi:hypothetical protein